MKLVLIGIPGAGKSTQGNLLSKQLKIPYLSTGHIFRTLAFEKSPLGRYIKKIINMGLLIPDEKTLSFVKDYLSRPEYKNGYIIDGFPRTVIQADEFKNSVDKVIYLELSDKEALWRLAYRNESVRSDDTIATILKRIDVFHQQTKPVIDYYNKLAKLARIDGALTINEVNQEILASLGKKYINNKLSTLDKKQKTIIGLVGLSGAGKSQAARYLAKKNLPVIYFGNAVNEYIDKHKLSHTNQHHQQARETIRKTLGMEALALLHQDQISSALKNNSVVVIDGVRSWEEYQYLKKTFSKVSIVLLCIWAPKLLRWKRIEERLDRQKIHGSERDIHELVDMNMAPTIAYADYMIVNSSSLSDFAQELEKIYREIYFK